MRERERQAEKTNRTEAAVCVRSVGSFRMFSTAVLQSAKLLEAYLLLALSFIIRQEEQGHLFGWRERRTTPSIRTDVQKTERTCGCPLRTQT